MKPVFYSRAHVGKPAGVALFLVLAFLALIITMVLAFFSSVTTELGTARSAVSQVTAKQLADTSVQVVGSVIRMATSAPIGDNTAWASQPGMIRTYGTSTGGAASTPLAYFKLYSSDDMEVTRLDIPSYDMALDVDGLWDTKKAMFTDLNSPVTDGAGKVHFPIIDPRAQTTSSTTSVQGFTYDSSITTRTSVVPVNGVVIPSAGAADSQRLPMPVKWIYVLKDGTLTAPRAVDVATGKIANWIGENNVAKKPSATNPIVGRIAFWTDDDTSKININTAAGDLKTLTGTEAGSFWDSPRAFSPMDLKFTRSQVATNEFQRYPGHPATVSLSAVFPSLDREQIGTLAPRVAWGGSKGGSLENYAGGVPLLARKTDRLYGSVDELIFKPTISSIQRDENITGLVTPDALEKARFFLTASSRAPDLNLFGQPRVCMWPVHEVNSPTYRTASDKLLAFCTTVGGRRYHFTRGNSTVATSTDRDADYAGSVPKSVPPNTRNQEIYAYLRKLTSKPIPGFGGPTNGFADNTKYGTLNRDQILTEIFDYIRITNLQDKSLAGGGKFTPNSGTTGSGQAVPIKITTSAGDTKGFGRMATISEAALQFYASEVISGKTTKMRAVLLLEAFCPAQGYAGLYPSYSHNITGLENLTITITTSTGNQTMNLKFPANATNNVVRTSGQHSRSLSGTEGIANGFFAPSGNKTFPGLDPKINYPFISQTDIDVSAATVATMKLTGGDITLSINCKDSTGALVQTIKLKFPAITTLPLPTDSGITNYQTRINNLGSNAQDIIDVNDVIHSLEPSGSPVNGDLRLVAASETVADTVFMPHASYASNTKMAHSLKTGINRPYNLSTYGKLVITPSGYGNYQPAGNPDFPSKIATGALMSTGLRGDWDNGIANYLDGPYINKADEGTTSIGTAGGPGPYWSSNTDVFAAATLFSPNRQIASPVMLGSLPTGAGYSPQRPWQTLLFRPDAAGTHPGSVALKDYLMLDLFTMPIVEPYAISEPLSTAGRVNMNYQIAPFSYIKRDTAVRAALQSIWTVAIPDADSAKYKDLNSGTNCRNPVAPDEILKQFQARFDIADPTKPTLFVSAAEICDLHLVPKGTLLTAMQSLTYWDNFKLTGDNTREMPYNHLYPLLTTKSNTYTVHMRVQVLKKVRATADNVWDEGSDQVQSEYRGSSVIERYIDPDDSRFQSTSPNYVDSDKTSLDELYRIRVLSTKKFN